MKQDKTIIDNILDRIRKKKLVRRYLLLLVSLFISAILFNLISLPTKIVSGGVGGISIITDHVFHISPSIMILVISVALLVVSVFTLGLEKTSGTIVATLVYPLLVSLTKDIGNYIIVDKNELLLLSIFLGVIGGISSGIIFKTGFSSGGLNIISQILYKYYHISISKSNFVINTIVVLVGSYFFGTTMLMYAIIILYINSLMIDKVLLGVSKNKAFYIITTKEEEVKTYVMDGLGHGITMFNVRGGYNDKKNQVLMCVIPSKEYFKVTEGIKLIDDKAFFVVTDAYQVSGGA